MSYYTPSYASGAVLDAPDLDLRTLLRKQWMGDRLSSAEASKLARRMEVRRHVENETRRTGGTVRDPLFEPMPAPTPTRVQTTDAPRQREVNRPAGDPIDDEIKVINERRSGLRPLRERHQQALDNFLGSDAADLFERDVLDPKRFQRGSDGDFVLSKRFGADLIDKRSRAKAGDSKLQQEVAALEQEYRAKRGRYDSIAKPLKDLEAQERQLETRLAELSRLRGVPMPAQSLAAAADKPRVRMSPLSNDATIEEKIADNALGPHRGADGLPSTWNVPKRVAGRMNGGNLDDAEKLPDGTIAMIGRDGLWKLWQDGRFVPLDADAGDPLRRESGEVPTAAPTPAAGVNGPAVVNDPAGKPAAPSEQANAAGGGGAMSVLAPAAAAALLNPAAVSKAFWRAGGMALRGGAQILPAARAAATGYAIGTAVNNLPRAFGSRETLTDKGVDAAMGTYQDWVKEPIRPTYPPPARTPAELAGAAWMGMGGMLPRTNVAPARAPAERMPTITPAPLAERMPVLTPAPLPPAAQITPVEPPERFPTITPAPQTPLADDAEELRRKRVSLANPFRPMLVPKPYQTAAARFNPFGPSRATATMTDPHVYA